MTERCDDLDRFFDRELELEADHAFRDHLAGCSRCQDVLLGRMLEIAVVAEARPSRPSFDPLPTELLTGRESAGADARSDAHAEAAGHGASVEDARRAAPDAPADDVHGRPVELVAADDLPVPIGRRRRLMLVAAAVLPLAAAGMLYLHSQGPGRTAEVASGLANQQLASDVSARVAAALGPERVVDVRFSAAPLDRHRPPVVVRAAGDLRHERISQQLVSQLELRGNTSALVGTRALNGDLDSAQDTATNLASTAAGFSDRAAVMLLRGRRAAQRPEQIAAAERAVSLTASALRIDPRSTQARWNQALALQDLGLPRVAAREFDEIAARSEPGWAEEARDRAVRLRGASQRDADDWDAVKSRAEAMASGGPVLGDAEIRRAPSLARDQFYVALATADTADRIAALAPLARALDAQFATTALGDLVAAVRSSDLAVRAPLARELRGFLAPSTQRPDKLDGLPTRAAQRGVRDIALAALLVIGERGIDGDDLALFDRLLAGGRDDWWQLVALARRAYWLEFAQRDYAGVYAAERRAAPLCRTLASRWCQRIALFAGSASSQMGRADLAIEQLTRVVQDARTAALPADEADALEQLGQAIAIRVADGIDSAAVANAYLDDVALRKNRCSSRVQRLDFAANAALQHHRFAEAARARSEADALEGGECSEVKPRLNGETARLRLVLAGRDRLDALRLNVARLDALTRPGRKLYVELLSAGATLVDDPARGQAALRRVIDNATAEPSAMYAQVVRGLAFDVLIEAAAASHDARAVLGLVGERLGAPRLERCAVAVASWNRLVVAALDSAGQPAIDLRDVPEGAVMIGARAVVSPELRKRLSSCPRIDVMASGPYFGAARLLDDRVAWSYHAGPPRAPGGRVTERELVVSDVAPPAELHLAALQRFTGRAGAQLLSGRDATPANVLAAMTTASLVVIVAHGITAAEDPSAASLILSPDPQGDYLLTASKVGDAKLTGAPIVVLAGCDAGRVQVSGEPWSLATSLLAAGARAVIAPTEPIPDGPAGDVFGSLIERIRNGANPADALVAERGSHGAEHEWLSSVVVFE